MIELNKIYCENNLETMKRMPDNFLDLTVTSPPYDNLRTYNGKLVWGEHIWKPVIEQLYRVTKDGGVVVWVVNDATIKGSETLTSFKQALYFREVGFNIHDTMIYKKICYPPLTHNRYEQCFEYMFVVSIGKPITFNQIMVKTETAGTKRPRYKSNKEFGSAVRNDNRVDIIKEEKYKNNVWDLRPNNSHHDHPAMFPEQLAKDHIISWSNEGDLIYDPFMGSGTTAKMAHLLKRNWIGSEISQEYVDLANKRLDPYLRQEILAI